MKKEQLKKPVEAVSQEEKKATAPTFSMVGAVPWEARAKEGEALSAETPLEMPGAMFTARQENPV